MPSMKVSVIVPIYNVEPYLDECVRSVLHQTHRDIDLVLVDDGSSDKSFDIAARYAVMDPRVFLITKPNGGSSSARNLGLELMYGTDLRNLLEQKSRFLGHASSIVMDPTRPLSEEPRRNNWLYDHPVNLDNCQLTAIKRSRINHEKTSVCGLDIAKHFARIEDRIYECDIAYVSGLIVQELPGDRLIHFLDGDDYLSLDCLQNVVEVLKVSGATLEVITHGTVLYQESSREYSRFPSFGYHNSKKHFYLTGSDYLIDNDLDAFYFTWQGVFKAEILNRYGLRFTDKIFHQDHDFGTILFILANGVMHCDFDGLVYRRRQGSVMTSFEQTCFPSEIPSYLECMREFFDNYQDLRRYYRAYCLCLVAHRIHVFLQQHDAIDKRVAKLLQRGNKYYVSFYINEYSHLNYLNPRGLLRDMGITVTGYKMRYAMVKWCLALYRGARYCWRHPLKALKKCIRAVLDR